MRPPVSLACRSWWWVFGLFIALPAIALAVLGLGAIRADEIERQQRAREQEVQIARLVGAALLTTFDREIADVQVQTGLSTKDSRTSDWNSVLFAVDNDGVVSFSAEHLFTGPVGRVPAGTAVQLPPDIRSLVDRAQSASAQGRVYDAASDYARLRTFAEIRDWVDLQTGKVQASDRALASSDARSPAGIPVAIVASSYNEDERPAERRRFKPLIEETLRNLRAGRWPLDVDQRRTYDDELRRWLREIDPPGNPIAEDEHLEWVAACAAAIRDLFEQRSQMTGRARVVDLPTGRTLLVWEAQRGSSRSWSGVAIPRQRVSILLDAALGSALRDLPLRVALGDRQTVVWGESNNIVDGHRIALDSVPEWGVTFQPVPGSRSRARRLLDDGRVVLPIVVLACGLFMTGWIVRRELALTELQSTFVGAVTHEFKSPLTSIRLLLERLSSGRMAPGDSAHRYYDAIGAETARLEDLVNRLLEAQKLQNGQKTYVFRPTAIEQIVRDTVERMRPQADAKGIRLDARIASGISPLPLDVDSVADAVRNLLDNAIKYSPPATRIVVSLDEQDGRVELIVDDEGIGIDSADAPRIFDPFFRSRRGDHANVHGTGLGLSLVKATAEAHGGTITVSSDGASGSRFMLVLPVARQSLDPIQAGT